MSTQTRLSSLFRNSKKDQHNNLRNKLLPEKNGLDRLSNISQGDKQEDEEFTFKLAGAKSDAKLDVKLDVRSDAKSDAWKATKKVNDEKPQQCKSSRKSTKGDIHRVTFIDSASKLKVKTTKGRRKRTRIFDRSGEAERVIKLFKDNEQGAVFNYSKHTPLVACSDTEIRDKTKSDDMKLYEKHHSNHQKHEPDVCDSVSKRRDLKSTQKHEQGQSDAVISKETVLMVKRVREQCKDRGVLTEIKEVDESDNSTAKQHASTRHTNTSIHKHSNINDG